MMFTYTFDLHLKVYISVSYQKYIVLISAGIILENMYKFHNDENQTKRITGTLLLLAFFIYTFSSFDGVR